MGKSFNVEFSYTNSSSLEEIQKYISHTSFNNKRWGWPGITFVNWVGNLDRKSDRLTFEIKKKPMGYLFGYSYFPSKYKWVVTVQTLDTNHKQVRATLEKNENFKRYFIGWTIAISLLFTLYLSTTTNSRTFIVFLFLVYNWANIILEGMLATYYADKHKNDLANVMFEIFGKPFEQNHRSTMHC